MPEISRFYGIVIKMFFGDHNPPRFHAEYSSEEALIGIETLGVIAGELSPIRESGEPIQITRRGQVVAQLIPSPPARASSKSQKAVWASLDQLAAQIGSQWPKRVSATRAVRSGRR